MAAIALILERLLRGERGVVVEYARAVRWEGSPEAQRLMYKAFRVVDDAWRGIGFLPKSGLRLRDRLARYDAFAELGVREVTPSSWRADNPPGCRCAEVVLGKARPTDCPHFMRDCTPSRPYGPCMVSSEGTCAIWARFGGGGLASELARRLGLA